MKHFSFKILFLGILLPPVLYILTLQVFEAYLYRGYLQKIEETYIGDTGPLFEGEKSIRDQIASNIEGYINTRKSVLWGGLSIDVLVTTKGNRIIYPAFFNPEDEKHKSGLNPMDTARENYRILNDGLDVKLELKIDHNTVISNLILFLYLFLFGTGLYLYFLSVNKKIKLDDTLKADALERLSNKEREYVSKLNILESEQTELTTRISMMRSNLTDEKKRASINEDEMINEIVALEEKLEENVQFSKIQEEEIQALQEKLSQFEKKSIGKKKEKGLNVIEKRFKALYKNVGLDKKALAGFDELTEDMKIKCEEVIHHLNDHPEQVIIKRKVFNKKSSLVFFEVRFAYKGRLYFSKDKSGRIDVIVIGTKNTQTKDLDFLDNY